MTGTLPYGETQNARTFIIPLSHPTIIDSDRWPGLWQAPSSAQFG